MIVCATSIFETGSSMSKEDLHKWYLNIQNSKFQCSAPPNHVTNSDQIPLLTVIDCDEPGASYRYNFRLSNGKKPKKGLFNGYATVDISSHDNQFNENFNFGLRHKKCIKVNSRDIAQITGYFTNDKLMV